MVQGFGHRNRPKAPPIMLISQPYRDPPPGMPRVLALFSFRYDAHLVPGLIANLAPIVHGHIAWDDRAADAALSSEPARRNALLARAQHEGADWLLVADPDERFEDRLAEALPELVSKGDDILWRFRCHEMFGPDQRRTDGIWGGKTMIRLFPARAAPGGLETALHGGWVADPAAFQVRDAGIGFYHLRMAHPARRRLRRDLYAAATRAGCIRRSATTTLTTCATAALNRSSKGGASLRPLSRTGVCGPRSWRDR